MSDIDEIFEDETDKTDVVEEEAQAEPETKDEPTEESKGDKEEPAEDEPADESKSEPPADEDSQWTKTMALDERRKRQAAEERLRELESKLTKEEPKKERPDVFEDAEGAFKHTEETFEQRILNERINLSRSMMEMTHEDYADVEQSFIQLAKENPALVQQMYANPNPAKFAYDTAKKHMEMQKFTDPQYAERLKADLRKEILAELNQEQKPSEAELRNQTAANVTDLTTTTAKGGNTNQVEKLEDLDDMFADSAF